SRKVQRIRLTTSKLVKLRLLFIITCAAGNNASSSQQSAQQHKAGSSHASSNIINGLCAGHVALLYLVQVVGKSLCKTKRAVLKAAYKDIGRCALERKNSFAKHAKRTRNLHNTIRNSVLVVVSSFQRLLTGVVSGSGQQIGVHVARLQL